jgi:DNA replication protein DnaC
LRVVEAEILLRKENAAARRLKEAGFPEILRLEDYDFTKVPGLDREHVMRLSELGFIDHCEAVLLLGPSSVGKSHLSIALGVRACQAGYRVRFVRAYDLLKRLYAALADDTLDEVIDDLCVPALLVIDELGNSPRKPEHDYAGVFFELIARRHRRGSLIVSTNLGLNEWNLALGTAWQVTPAIELSGVPLCEGFGRVSEQDPRGE